MNKSETIGKLAEGLTKAQADFGPLIKGAANPFFKSKYADLSGVMDVARGPLAENGLCFVQTTEEAESGFLVVETTLIHVSGEWISGRLKMPTVKQDPQGFGSAMTYARRYALQAILGLAAEDDDGEGAMTRDRGKKERGAAQTTPPPSIFDAAAEAFSKIDSLTHLANHFKKHFKEYEADPRYAEIVTAKDRRKTELAAFQGEGGSEDPDWVKPEPTSEDKSFLQEAVKSIASARSVADLEKWATANSAALGKSPYKDQIRAEYASVKDRFKAAKEET